MFARNRNATFLHIGYLYTVFKIYCYHYEKAHEIKGLLKFTYAKTYHGLEIIVKENIWWDISKPISAIKFDHSNY
jgi:hypothetical protein